jgi:hypothetical protein
LRASRIILALALLAPLPRACLAQATVEVAAFSRLRAGVPVPEWLGPYAFTREPRHTEYALVEDEGRVALRARQWKVASLPENADLRTRAGDDFAARLYVLFDLPDAALSPMDRVKLVLARRIWGHRVPNATLCYVWDVRAPVGTIAPSAYTGRVRMVVVDSGPALLGRWVARERNVAEDFRAAFGMEAPPVAAIVLAADTDNTGASTEAYFGDVAFRAASP